jgi:HlyD family secretion protein
MAVSPGNVDERAAPPPPSVASANGVVEPAQSEIRVGAAVAGQIARIAVTEGQRIAAGDSIAELDRRVEAAALAAAEADVLAARAELDRVVRGTRTEDLRAARAEAEGARARATLARGVAARIERAASVGAITGDELDRAQREAESAAAAARGAEAREQAAIAGSRREDVQLARARLAGAEARRDQAAALHARMLIVAPSAGEVLQLSYSVGEYYQAMSQGGASQPLAVLGDTTRLRVRLDVDERDIGRIVLGAKTMVRASAFPGKDYPGAVVEIGRRMGRKNVRTDDPIERNDTKILEVVVELDAKPPLVVGQRVTGYVLAD